MDRFVVTIARENGSGGRVIGEQLADRLKVPFYNRALLRLASGGLSLAFIGDFTQGFTAFHHIFFDNDLWILDPRTDLLINIVPEPFFVDTAARIGLLFGGSVLILFAACFLWLYRQKRNHAAGA